MKQVPTLTFAELDRVLSKAGLKSHPSQIHGLICGLLCGTSQKHVSWETWVTEAKENEQVHTALQNLYEATTKQLADFLFDFQLLMPSDNEELVMRAEALTLWCQGFLTGLQNVNVPIIGRKPGDTTEAINDLIEIAKMNYEEVVASDEDEAAYVELVEYVRMAAILIYQDSHDADPANADPVNTKNLLH